MPDLHMQMIGADSQCQAILIGANKARMQAAVAASVEACRLVARTFEQLGMGLHDNKRRIDNWGAKLQGHCRLQNWLQSHCMGKS